jgi:hypothetical protein
LHRAVLRVMNNAADGAKHGGVGASGDQEQAAEKRETSGTHESSESDERIMRRTGAASRGWTDWREPLCARSSEIGFRDFDQATFDQAMEESGGPRTEWEASCNLPQESRRESGGKTADGQAEPTLTGVANSAHKETVKEQPQS